MSETNVAKVNFLFKAFSFFKIPLIFYCGLKVVELDSKKAVIKIPLNRRTKNHLNSMYFGALAVGADVAGGIIAFDIIQRKKIKVALVFKDMQAEFLKRAETDVYFVSEDGESVDALINKTLASGEREEDKVTIIAYSNYKNPKQEIVAKFVLTLSLKKRG